MSEIYTGNNITIENFGYNKANINIKGKTEQKIIQEVQGEILTGESISVNDIEKEKGKIEIKGNAEQEVRSGKNLFNINGEFTKNGSDTSHSVSGNALTVEGKWYVGQVIDIEANTDYYMSFTKTAGDIRIYTVDLQTSLKTFNSSGLWNSGDYTQIALLFNSGANGSDSATAVFTNAQFEKGSTATKYEAYGASPSLDYPSEIVTVGQNIQLFNEETITEKTFISSTTGEALYNEVWTQSDFIEVEPNTIYTVNNETAFSGGSFIQISNYNNLKQWIKSEQGGGTGNKFHTFTTDNAATYIKVGYRNDKNLKDIKVVKGTKVGGYSPYGQGSVEIEIINTNLIPFAYKTGHKVTYDSGVTIEYLEENRVKLTGAAESGVLQAHLLGANRINWKKGNTYTLSLKKVSGSITGDIVAHTSFKNDNKDVWNNLAAYLNKSKTITIEEDGYSPRLVLYSNKGTIFNDLILEVQLQAGTEVREYAPHESQKVSLPIQKEFVKIGDYEDTFIKQDGKWYEKHIIKKFTYVGTENSWSINANAQGLTYFYISSNHNSNYIAMSNYFKSLSESGWNYNGSEAVFYAHNTMGFLNTGCEELNEWKELLARWNENGNPLQVYRYVQTPELIPCTEEQEEILEQLHDFPLYLPTTNLSVRSSTYPNIMLRYNYVIPSPSIEKPSKILTVGQNVQLFDKNNANILNGFINKDDKILTSSTTNKILYVPISGGKVYTVSKVKTDRFTIGTTNEIPVVNSTIIDVVQNNGTNILKIEASTNAKYLLVHFWRSSDTLTEQEILDSIKIVEGTEIGSYSPYGQGSVEIDVVNKNILKFRNDLPITVNGVTISEHNGKLVLNGTATATNDGITIGKIDVVTGENYIMSVTEKKIGCGLNMNGNTVGITSVINLNKSATLTTSLPATPTSDGTATLYMAINSGVVFNNFEFGIQIEKDDVASSIIPHESQKVSLPIQKEFVKIGDYEDTFIKQDGKWYEAHLNNKLILDGSEAWTIRADVNNENTVCFRNTLRTVPYDNMKNNVPLLCDSLKCNNTFDDYEHIRYMGAEGYRIQILLNKTRATTVDEFKMLLSSNNITIYYVLESPELIECTPAQENILNQLENIQLYEGINNIMSTSFIAPSLEIIVTKAIEDYKCYISTAGKLVIPDSKIEYLIDFNESNIPTMPEATESSVRAAGRDGDIVLATTYEPIPLNIVCYTEDNLTLLEKVEEEKKINKFLNSIKNRTIDLAIEKDNKYYNVKYSGALTTINFPKHLKFAIPLKSSASYGKDLIQKSIVGSGKGESETIEATGATFVIRGPAIKPIISFNDYSMEYNIDILEGARVEIDSNKSTATHVNSDGIRTNVMKHYNHQFPKIENGINELKILSGLDDDMNVSVVWNDLKL